ncbi:MAG: SurA N-terminal domain-containing protein, partial [Succinivibrionaceae bacterium]|nr:SurA N-terminal domain-containing protein [Succinivibrionaceae bacterium]
MLTDKLRAGAQGRIFKVIFWVIILSFVLTGVGGYLIPRLNTDPVTVGEYPITAQDWTNQYNRETQRLYQMMGGQFSDLMDNHEFASSLRRRVLEQMVDSVAINAAAHDMGIRIGDEQIKEYIRTEPAFQKDGKFDNDLYLATVRNMGYTPDYYAERLRTMLMASSATEPMLRLGSRPLPYEVEQMTGLYLQKRVADLYRADPATFRKGITLKDGEDQAYYDAHHDTFMAPATVRFNYVLVNVETIKHGINPTDAQIEEYYNLHQDEFEVPERRKASHIIIKEGEGAAEKVRAVEEGIARKVPFADLARRYSDDPAARDDGGAMGEQDRESLSRNLADALYALKEVGDASPKVVDGFGTHFMCLDGIIAAHVPPLKEVEAEVRSACINQEGDRIFNEQVATLTDVSFENPDSLDATAEALKLKVQDSGLISRGDPSTDWPLNLPEVQKAAFDPQVQGSGTNSQAINAGQGAALVINVQEHHDAALRPFAEVKAEAAKLLTDERAHAAAREALTALAAALK